MRNFKMFTGIVVKVIVSAIGYRGIIRSTEILHPWGIVLSFILSCYMVGDNIYYHLHPLLVGTLDQLPEFLQPVSSVFRYIRIHLIIILDSIRRTCSSLHYIRIIIRNSVCGVIPDQSMMTYACVPNMGNS